MRAPVRGFAFVLVWPFVASLAGCSGSDPVAGAGPDTSAVSAAAEVAAAAVGDSGGAADVVAGLMASVVVPQGPASTAPIGTGRGSSPGSLSGTSEVDELPTCPPEGEVGAGISFTCTDDAGTLVFTFSGTLATPSGPAELSGSLTAVPSADPPASGTEFDLEYSATITGPGGTASFSGTGTLVLDDSGAVSEFRLTATHTGTGGASSASTVVVTPNSVDVTIAADGDTVRFFLDRASGTGTVQVNGTTVANLGFAGGCFTVDYLDPAVADETICPGE